MNNKFKYWEIYDHRFKEITDNVDSKSANPGTARAILVVIPYTLIISLFEFLWKRLFSKK